MGRLERVLGSKNRGGQYFAAYDAAWGPLDSDGYPKPLWDRTTGLIDKDVAAYMRDHGFDLRRYLETHWATLGPNLIGKIHVYVSDMDGYYSNLGVYLLEEFLTRATNPSASATFDYGRPMKPHGWQPMTNADMIRMMARRMNTR